MTTPWKSNIALENKPSQKERIIFQPSFFSGKLAGKLRAYMFFFPTVNCQQFHEDFCFFKAYEYLVGGFNPFEKYARQNGNIPQGSG